MTVRYAKAGEPCPRAFIGALNKHHRRPEGAPTPSDWLTVQPHHHSTGPGLWLCFCGERFQNNTEASEHRPRRKAGHALVWWCGEHTAPEQGPREVT